MKKPFVYALSTCPHCRKTKVFLEEQSIPFEHVDVDLLEGEERDRMIEEVRKYNPRLTFPTVVVGDEVIVGYDPVRVKELCADE